MTATSGLQTLLRLRLCLMRNLVRAFSWRDWMKTAMVLALTLGFLLGEGALALWLFGSLRAKEDFAAYFVVLLGQRLLSLVFLVSLSMLFFSNVTTSLATIYLSRDLDLLLATPVPSLRVFMLKFMETLLNSSYMVVLFVTPILVAYGYSFGAPLLFYLQIPVTLVLFVIPPAAGGVLITILLMRYLPARRTHQALTAAGLLLGVSFVTGLRVLAPERLLKSASTEDFAAILRALDVPGTASLPSAWVASIALATLQHAPAAALGPFLQLAGLASISLMGMLLLARPLYFRGVTASHEGGRQRRPVSGVRQSLLGLGGRDLRLFLRDPTQWSQALLLVALVVIYVFNITALPRELTVVGAFVTIGDVVAWLNVGLAGFVLGAICMRFVLPSVSMEGGAFWVLAASPIHRSVYVLRKLMHYAPPLMLFSLVLAWLSGRALQVDEWTLGLTLITSGLVTFTLTAMALGLGAAWPSFKLENPAQFVLTGGGLLFGVLALLYVVSVVALEAKPFFWHLLIEAGVLDARTVNPWPWLVSVALVSAGLALGSLGLGMRRIGRLEV